MTAETADTTPPARAARALAAFPNLALLAIIAATYVGVTLWLGRNLWFYYDECDFLSRNLGSLTDLLRPHNEHWVTVPFLAYGSLKLLVGTASYMPYLLLLAATQILMAAAVYQLVAPRSRWFAIFSFTLLLFLGSGEQNQFWAFQVGFVLASGFGAWALVMADRQRPLAAALLLIASAASSNIGVVFVPAAAAVIGRRRELVWLAIPVVAFAAWYAAYGRDATLINNPLAPEQLALQPRYVLGSVTTALAGITGLGVFAALELLIAMLGGGIIAIGRGWRPPGLVVAALVGIVGYFVIIGLGRAQLAAYPSRYVTTVAVFVLAGVGSLLPLRIPQSARKFALGAALVFGFVALASNALAMREGAHLQLERDLSSLRCEPPAAPGP